MGCSETNVKLGKNVSIPQPNLVNLYGCTIGDGCKIAAFVEIQRDVVLGKNVKVEAFVFIPTGVIISNGVFIGPHVCFTNDKNPKAVGENGELLTIDEWTITSTIVEARASIGANVTIMCGITIGEGAMIGAGSVVTKDVPRGETWYGNPARRRYETNSLSTESS